MSDKTVKTCDYCEVEGVMPTFMNGETICYDCLRKQPKTITEATKLVFEYRKENERLVGHLADRALKVLKQDKRITKLEAVVNELYGIWCIAEHALEDSDYSRAEELKSIANKTI